MARPTRLIRAFPRPEAGGVDYDNDSSGLSADTLQEAIDELAALIGTGAFETKDEGGQPEVDDHGTAGATETIDATDGNHHRLTLDQSCAVTVNAFPDGSIVVAVYQDGTGGWDITWSGVTFAGDDQPDQTASSLTFYVLVSEDGAVYGFKAGGGGSGASALADLTDVELTSPQEDDTLRYVGGFWINDDRRWEAVTDGEDVFVWDGDDLVHEWEAY